MVGLVCLCCYFDVQYLVLLGYQFGVIVKGCVEWFIIFGEVWVVMVLYFLVSVVKFNDFMVVLVVQFDVGYVFNVMVFVEQVVVIVVREYGEMLRGVGLFVVDYVGYVQVFFVG